MLNRHASLVLVALWTLCAPWAVSAGTQADAPAKVAIEKLIKEDERPDPAEALQLAKSGAILVDVRSADEWADGHAKGALFMPWRSVKDEAPKLIPNKDQPIVTYCAVGTRARFAASKFRDLGYTHVVAMEDGFDEIKAAGYPVEVLPAPR